MTLPDGAKELLLLIAKLSEDMYWARWRDDIEYELWERLTAPDGLFERPGSRRAIIADELSELRRLRDLCGGWWTYLGDIWGTCQFVPIAEWEAMFAEPTKRHDWRR